MGVRRIAVAAFLVGLAALVLSAILGKQERPAFDDGVDCIGSGPC